MAHIAIDGTALWGRRRYSGVEKVVDRLLYRILREPHGHAIRIWVPADWPGFQEDAARAQGDPFAAEGICRLPFQGSQKLRRIAWQQAVFPLLLGRWKADLVFGPCYVLPLLSPSPGIALLHDLHGLRLQETRLENFLHYRLVLPPTLRRAAGVITTTDSVLEQARPYLSPGCLTAVAPLGVDAEFFDSGGSPASEPGPERPPAAGGSERHETILFVGNLEPRKGLILLLKAFAAVLRQRPGLRLVLAGKDRGLLGALQQAAAHLGVSGEVEFPGFVPAVDLKALYQEATVFCLPSLAEGFGLPPLEAMACGAPVSAVDSPSVRENLQGAALLVSPTASDLARGLLQILEDEGLRQRLIGAGRVRASSYSWDRMAAQFWDLAERVRSPAGCPVSRRANGSGG